MLTQTAKPTTPTHTQNPFKPPTSIPEPQVTDNDFYKEFTQYSNDLETLLHLQTKATLLQHKMSISNETKTTNSFVHIGKTLHKVYYQDKLFKTQREFLEWTKESFGFGKSTTYEYIISYRVYCEIESRCEGGMKPPQCQKHCQLLAKVPTDQLVEVWKDVCKNAPGGVITTFYLDDYLEKLVIVKDADVQGMRILSNSCTSEQTVDLFQSFPQSSGNSMEIDVPQIEIHNNGSPNTEFLVNLEYKLNNSSPKSPAQPRNNDKITSGANLPFNPELIFHLAKSVVSGSAFDYSFKSLNDLKVANSQVWSGSVWANLTSLTQFFYGESHRSIWLEKFLQIIFTKYAHREFGEGLFLLRAEFGADWFTPVLQYPYCILRHFPNFSTKSKPLDPLAPSLSPFSNTQSINSNKNLQSNDSYIVFYLGKSVYEFSSTFRSVGLVPGINSWALIPSPKIEINTKPDQTRHETHHQPQTMQSPKPTQKNPTFTGQISPFDKPLQPRPPPITTPSPSIDLSQIAQYLEFCKPHEYSSPDAITTPKDLLGSDLFFSDLHLPALNFSDEILANLDTSMTSMNDSGVAHVGNQISGSLYSGVEGSPKQTRKTIQLKLPNPKKRVKTK
ncbi:hypothetical protein HK098_002115 [Nowakowskiella sp. JEL0407]|nr:hypothetical protein HK098_002115 [Nowakowskiella sp. JEL0407]